MSTGATSGDEYEGVGCGYTQGTKKGGMGSMTMPWYGMVWYAMVAGYVQALILPHPPTRTRCGTAL